MRTNANKLNKAHSPQEEGVFANTNLSKYLHQRELENIRNQVGSIRQEPQIDKTNQVYILVFCFSVRHNDWAT
jgi:ABC-type phosphate/phosphonate transport system ATPase subunit